MQKQVEIENLTVRAINHIFNMQYHTKYCFTARELYETTNPSKWNITDTFVQAHGHRDRYTFCGYVLVYFFYLVFLDIIKNNITFEFPMTGGYSASIYVKCFQDEDFRRLYAGGKFLGIDFIASEFKGYQMFYQWRCHNRIKEKPIYINNKLKHWFYTQINNGKQYY